MTNAISIFKSKTLWFNLITFILVLVSLPSFISLLPSSWIPALAFITIIGNAILRTFFTSAPTTLNATGAVKNA